MGRYICQLSVKLLAICQLSVKFKAFCQLNFFNFISFALKNTKKKQQNNKKKNTVDMQTLVIRTYQYTNNNLNIRAGTPQQLKPSTADPKNKKI